MILELKRQIVHASGILLVLVLQVFGKWNTAMLILGTIIILIIVGRMRYFSKPKILKDLEKKVKGYERPKEIPLKGPITFFIGSLFAIIIFPETIAFVCIVVLAISDAVSTLIGKTYGKHKLWQSSAEGSLAFFISTLLIMFLFAPEKALLVAFGVTLVEMLPHIDDNLTIPLSVGVLLTL